MISTLARRCRPRAPPPPPPAAPPRRAVRVSHLLFQLGRSARAAGAGDGALPGVCFPSSLQGPEVETMVVNVATLGAAGKDAFMHFYDLARFGFGSSPSSPAAREAVRAMVEQAFWEGWLPCLGDGHGAARDTASEVPLLEIVTVDRAVCAAVSAEGPDLPVLRWLPPMLSASPRTAFLLSRDSHDAAAKALAANQVQTAFSVSSRHISLATLRQTNRRHLHSLSLRRPAARSPHDLVCSILTSSSSTVMESALAQQGSCDTARAVLAKPRSAEMLLRKVLGTWMLGLEDERADWTSGHTQTFALLCEPIASLAAALLPLHGSPSATAEDDPLGHLSSGCPLLQRVLLFVVGAPALAGENGAGAWNALLKELRDTYHWLKQREEEILADGDTTLFVAMEDESRTDTAAARDASRSGSGDWEWEGVLDRLAARNALLGRQVFSTVPTTRATAQREAEECGDGDEGGGMAVVPTIPSAGVDAGGHLTGVLRACDILCSAIGLSPHCRPPADGRRLPFSEPQGNSRATATTPSSLCFRQDLLTLRHLARVSLSRRYMTRPPHALWSLASSAGGNPRGDADMERTRALPFLQELTRSLAATDVPWRRVVVLGVATEETRPRASDGSALRSTAFGAARRPFYFSLSYLLPECAPQLLVTPLSALESAMGSPVAPTAVARGEAAKVCHIPLRCWMTGFPTGGNGQSGGSLSTFSCGAEATLLHLRESQLATMREHLRTTSRGTDSDPTFFVLRCDADVCLSLWPLEEGTFANLASCRDG